MIEIVRETFSISDTKEDFWNFVASDDIYEELLDVFNKIGKELRHQIDKKFSKFR